MELSLAVLSTLLFMFGLGITYWIHSQYHIPIVVDPEQKPSEDLPFASVIVPSRNEERNIGRCVTALLDQTYVNYELIVVDDRSTDRTHEILESLGQQNPHRLRVIAGLEPPPGWAGKPFALQQGIAQARGEWFCFVDADTFAAPELLSSTLATACAQSADMFSIFTNQELGSFWEKTILPLVFTALSFGFPAEKVNDPTSPIAIANGQFIMIRRAVYQAIGGHKAVRERVDEDKALAERVKRHGYRLIVADGRKVAVTRMYTRLAEIWEGWTKNIYLGMKDRIPLLLFGALVGLLGALALPLWLAGGLIWWLLAGGLIPALTSVQALLVWAYLLWQRVQACRAFGISAFYALTLPLGALLFTSMMFASAYNVLSGRGVTWKGRRYAA